MLLKNIARIFRENLAILGWRIALIGIVSILLSQTLIILLPKIFQQIIATIDSHGPYQTLAYWCGIATIVSLVAIAAQLVRYRVGDYSWGVVYARRTVDYKQLLTRKNYATLLNYGTGKLISRMSKGIDAEGDIMYHLVFSFAENIFRIGSICIILIYYSAWLALGMLSLLVVVALLQVLIAKKLAPVAEACETTHEDEKRHMARIVMENLLIRVSNREHSEVARGQEIVRDYPRLNFLYAMYSWSLFHLLELGFRGIEIAMFFWFGWQSIQWGVPIATIVMLSTYIWLAWGPIEHILSQVRTIGKEYESYVRMREVLDTPDIYADGAETYHHTRGDIELRNVSFGYTETITILQELSLRFEGGKTIALVGHSGSGKSTIMKLLLRIYDPRNGSILYDGQDLRDLRIETVYRHIGYLPQEPAIFDGTIRENLAYATTEREFSDHELWQALADARLDERVKQFETGLNTEIGERGVKLSGGERQRLAIARIFLKNPDIILLDEPTSALDSISEKIIGDLLVDLSHGKTVIIIAHRLQTVMHADTICVMDHGKVIERGTHAKLLAANGTYAKLVDLQSGTLRE